MKLKNTIILVILFGLVIVASAEESIPAMPYEFLGSVTIDGSPAPAGTVITALIDGEICGEITTTASGVYGGSSAKEGGHLLVTGTTDQKGSEITFKVNGKTAAQTAVFTPGNVESLDLSASGGGSSPSGNSGGSSGDGGSSYTKTTSAAVTGTTTVSVGELKLSTSSTGRVLETGIVKTPNSVASLIIPSGTTVRNKIGNPVEEISIESVDPSSLPPVEGENTIGLALDCSPDGATFDPAVTLTYALTNDEWAEIEDPSTLTVMWYDSDTGSWEEIPATVDTATHTITAQVSHFSIYALLWSSVQAEPTVQGEEKITTTSTPQTTTPAFWQSSLMLLFAGALVMIGIVSGGVLYVRREK